MAQVCYWTIVSFSNDYGKRQHLRVFHNYPILLKVYSFGEVRDYWTAKSAVEVQKIYDLPLFPQMCG